ncbi:unnamed protein product [Schistosoma curassoni]|uniref:30S ribosomal protein S18 n=1 Tax=Schistosoma curassoni TaxID=6186 RepID=A0A183KNU0_9TREM|nr:unnamed protein product [Schistosoma curassoni]
MNIFKEFNLINPILLKVKLLSRVKSLLKYPRKLMKAIYSRGLIINTIV